MKFIQEFWDFAKGKKTYIVALAAVIYGIYAKDVNIIIMGLGMAGIRSGIATEVAKVAVSKTPVETAKQDAPIIAADVIDATVTEVK